MPTEAALRNEEIPQTINIDLNDMAQNWMGSQVQQPL